RTLGRTRIGGARGQREEPLPGGGQFLVLAEPGLEGSDLQGEGRVLRIGGGRPCQMNNRLARAARRLENQRAVVPSFAEGVEVGVALKRDEISHALGDGPP